MLVLIRDVINQTLMMAHLHDLEFAHDQAEFTSGKEAETCFTDGYYGMVSVDGDYMGTFDHWLAW